MVCCSEGRLYGYGRSCHVTVNQQNYASAVADLHLHLHFDIRHAEHHFAEILCIIALKATYSNHRTWFISSRCISYKLYLLCAVDSNELLKIMFVSSDSAVHPPCKPHSHQLRDSM